MVVSHWAVVREMLLISCGFCGKEFRKESLKEINDAVNYTAQLLLLENLM